MACCCHATRCALRLRVWTAGAAAGIRHTRRTQTFFTTCWAIHLHGVWEGEEDRRRRASGGRWLSGSGILGFWRANKQTGHILPGYLPELPVPLPLPLPDIAPLPIPSHTTLPSRPHFPPTGPPTLPPALCTRLGTHSRLPECLHCLSTAC